MGPAHTIVGKCYSLGIRRSSAKHVHSVRKSLWLSEQAALKVKGNDLSSTVQKFK